MSDDGWAGDADAEAEAAAREDAADEDEAFRLVLAELDAGDAHSQADAAALRKWRAELEAHTTRAITDSARLCLSRRNKAHADALEAREGAAASLDQITARLAEPERRAAIVAPFIDQAFAPQVEEPAPAERPAARAARALAQARTLHGMLVAELAAPGRHALRRLLKEPCADAEGRVTPGWLERLQQTSEGRRIVKRCTARLKDDNVVPPALAGLGVTASGYAALQAAVAADREMANASRSVAAALRQQARRLAGAARARSTSPLVVLAGG